MVFHNEFLDKRKIKVINIVSLLLGFSQASIIYVMSSYFAKASGSENVGLFYAVSYLILLICLLNMHKLVRRVGKSVVFCFSILMKIVMLIFLSNTDPSVFSVFFLVAYMVFEGMGWVSLDTILESYSLDEESGRIRGRHLTILNAGFLLGPFISTQLLDKFGYYGIFIFLLILNSIIFLVVLTKLNNAPNDFRKDISITDMIKKVLRRKKISRIYYIACVLDFFYALMVIYTPIHLLNIGFNWDKIGTILTIMLIPFVILQYPMGIVADKKKNEGKLLVIGVVIMAVSTFAIYFIGSRDILIWSLVLFATRLGAAIVEVLRDSYFYKQIDGEDVDLIDFFRTAAPVGNIIAAGISFALLSFLPVKIVFILVAVVVFSALIPAFHLDKEKILRY